MSHGVRVAFCSIYDYLVYNIQLLNFLYPKLLPLHIKMKTKLNCKLHYKNHIQS